MAVNLLGHPAVFRYLITCDAPHQPGHGPEASANSSSKGFLAAYFKRPPVTLTFSFTDPRAVQIQKITFRPKVLGQSSTSISTSVRRSGDSKILFLSRSSWPPDTESITLDGSSNFRSHNILPRRCSDSSDHITKKKTFSLPKSAALGDVGDLLLTITSTNGGNAVALSNVEIYGQPSLKIGREKYNLLAEKLRIPFPLEDPPIVLELPLSHQGIRNNVQLTTPRQSRSEPEIPREYLDALTFELMCDPVTLPSGATIDMSSLKKHEAVQAEFGRRLFDPFSGKPITFRDVRRDAELQKRIHSHYHRGFGITSATDGDSEDESQSRVALPLKDTRDRRRLCSNCGIDCENVTYTDSKNILCRNCALLKRENSDADNHVTRSICRIHVHRS